MVLQELFIGEDGLYVITELEGYDLQNETFPQNNKPCRDSVLSPSCARPVADG